MFTLGLMIIFGTSIAFSYELTFAQVETPPDRPIDLEVNVISSTQINLSWSLSDDNDSSVTGFKIEARINTDPDFSVIVEDTGSTDTEYTHTDLASDVSYVQYRVYAINQYGPSENYASEAVNISENSDSDQNNEDGSDIPTNVKIKETSSNSVELTWDPPTKTYGQTIQSYTIKEELVSGEYIKHDTSGSDTKSTISDLNEDKTYVFVVVANYVEGTSSGDSKEVKITLNSSSSNDDDDNNTSDPDDVPDRPDDLEAKAISSTEIDLSWKAPDDDDENNAAVTGYKIEVQKEGDSSYETVVEDTKSTSTTYSHTDLDADTNYTYQVYSINSKGESTRAESTSAKTLSSDNDDDNNTSQQNSSTSDNNTSQQNSSTSDNNTSQQNSSTSDNNTSQQNSSTSDNISSINDVKKASMETFSTTVDPEKDPQHYIDRYNNEPAYQDWFDRNFPEITIYEALSMEKSEPEPTPEPETEPEPTPEPETEPEPTPEPETEPEPTPEPETEPEPTPEPETEPEPTPETTPQLAAFVDPEKDPQHYVDRYNNEPAYQDWFDKNYPEYSSIYHAVGLDNPADIVDQNNTNFTKCGPGTEQVGDICVILKTQEKPWWQFW